MGQLLDTLAEIFSAVPVKHSASEQRGSPDEAMLKSRVSSWKTATVLYGVYRNFWLSLWAQMPHIKPGLVPHLIV